MISRRLLISALFIALLPFPSAFAAQAPASVPLDAFAGEYTPSGEPGNAVSFYVRNGKLTFESDRSVPTELKRVSATAFGFGNDDDKIAFSLDASGQAASFSLSSVPGAIYLRSGPPVHHLFHDYAARRSHDSHARRRQAARGDSQARRHRRAAAHSHPAHALRRRKRTTASPSLRSAPNWRATATSSSREDIRGRYKSQGKFIMMRPLADHRNPEGHRRKHRRLRHRCLAPEKRARQQRPRRRRRHQLSTASWP